MGVETGRWCCSPEVPDTFKPLHPATSWICSRSSRVQILGHALYIANWSVSCQFGFLTMLCSFIKYLIPLFKWHACTLAI